MDEESKRVMESLEKLGERQKRRCGICLIEKARVATTNGLMSAEMFAEIYEKTLWKMKSSAHKKRMACSEECFNEMMNILGTGMEKCRNIHCKHTKKLHINSVTCSAVRCKCNRFVTEEEETENVKKNVEESPEKLRDLIVKAKKI